jgi:carboxymethylenebutenolidase
MHSNEVGAISIATPDGPMAAFVAAPRPEQRIASVVMFQHIGGLSETMRVSAREAAVHGYCCIVPDLYHRLGRIVVDPTDPDEHIAAIRTIAVNSLRGPTVLQDVRAAIRWLHEAGELRGALGAIGYGAGAGAMLHAAGSEPALFGWIAAILGSGFVKPGREDSPHLVSEKIRAEIYCAFAGDDEVLPASLPAEVEQRLQAARTDHSVVVHPRMRHGYCFPHRTAYDTAAAEADWQAIAAMAARPRTSPSPLEGEGRGGG